MAGPFKSLHVDSGMSKFRVPSFLERRDGRRSLVVVRQKIKRRSSYSLPTFRQNVLVKCIKTGMGSSLGQPVNIGTLVRGGSPNPHKPQRTSSNTERLTSLQGKSLQPVSSSLCRQHGGSGITAESGTNLVECSECSSQRDLNLGGEQCHSSPTTVCVRSRDVLADSLSRSKQVIGSEWDLDQKVVDELLHRWPTAIGLFATSEIFVCQYTSLYAFLRHQECAPYTTSK